jgi:hypothetical protein
MTMRMPSYRWRFAHLAALWGYGVSQPIFSMLKGNPEFLVINGASRMEAVAFAVVVAFGPPLIAVGTEIGCGVVSSKLSALVHDLAVWLFGFTALLQILQRFDPTRAATLLIPAVGAYAAAIAYTRWRPIQTFLSISLVLPVVGLIVFVTTAPLALADAEGAQVDVPGSTPVVFVVLDEFAVSSLMRADGSIDATRYPAFGRLARDGTWYPRATSVNENTTFAVPAILTGDDPTNDELPTLADYPNSIFTLLGRSYAFRAQEPVTRLCPVRYCPEHRSGLSLERRVTGLMHDVGVDYLYGALPRDVVGSLSPLREGWGDLVENSGNSREDFLESINRGNPAKTFYFLHLLEPHVPWDLLPSGRHYNDGAVIAGITDDWAPGKYEQWRDDPGLVDQGIQRHLLQVGAVDRFIGQVLDHLRAAGLYDRALVVVTADHGVSFRPGGWRRHATEQNVADIAGVPLFVKYPGERHGHVDPRDAKTIDIVPTIASVLGIALPWSVDGHSLTTRPVERPVTIGRRHDPTVKARPEAVAADVLSAARRNAALFGQGDDSLYRIGPRPDLLGRSVSTLPRTAAADADVTIDRALDLETVRKSTGYVPSQILGRISWGSLRPAETLAVAVNGRVAATTEPYMYRGTSEFSTMVDEDVLHDGRNTVDLFAVKGLGAETHLVLLGGNNADTARVAAAAGG